MLGFGTWERIEMAASASGNCGRCCRPGFLSAALSAPARHFATPLHSLCWMGPFSPLVYYILGKDGLFYPRAHNAYQQVVSYDNRKILQLTYLEKKMCDNDLVLVVSKSALLCVLSRGGHKIDLVV